MAENVYSTKPPNRLACDGGYKEKTLLITGATGFMGKVLIAKMLRTCPLVEKICVIIRSKKGKDPQVRLNEMFTNPLFDLLKSTRGEEILKKVIAVPGDVTELGLGLSERNRKLLTEEVEIIFHFAATVRFGEPFKKAVMLNSRGTKLMVDLAKECKKLLVFTHISTAYCQPQEKILYEKPYPPPADPYKVIKTVENLDEDAANALGERLMVDSPNTYAFSKALAETIVNDEMDNLPVIILRPSLVLPVWKDPLPGWTDGMNGPIQTVIALGKGFLKTLHCNGNTYLDYLPVDIGVDAVMLATYYYMVYKKKRIFNLTTSTEFVLPWNKVFNMAQSILNTRMPLNSVVWYPGLSLQPSEWLHNVNLVLFHYIPAVILDSLKILTGKKPVSWKVQQRLTSLYRLLDYYLINQFHFNNDNGLEARILLNETEKEIYKIDSIGMDPEQFLYNMIHGVRLYTLKESDESLPTARRHLKVMWALDRIWKLFILLGAGHLILKYIFN